MTLSIQFQSWQNWDRKSPVAWNGLNFGILGKGASLVFLFSLNVILPLVFLSWLNAMKCRSNRREVFYKKVFLKISQNSHENTCARVSFLIKLQVFSCKFCKTFKSTFFNRTFPVAASGYEDFIVSSNTK